MPLTLILYELLSALLKLISSPIFTSNNLASFSFIIAPSVVNWYFSLVILLFNKTKLSILVFDSGTYKVTFCLFIFSFEILTISWWTFKLSSYPSILFNLLIYSF